MKNYTEKDYQEAAERCWVLFDKAKIEPLSAELEQRLDRLRAIRYGIRRRIDKDFDQMCQGGPRFH